jgi:hypothetical protein
MLNANANAGWIERDGDDAEKADNKRKDTRVR